MAAASACPYHMPCFSTSECACKSEFLQCTLVKNGKDRRCISANPPEAAGTGQAIGCIPRRIGTHIVCI